jgi:hypothetical protein
MAGMIKNGLRPVLLFGEKALFGKNALSCKELPFFLLLYNEYCIQRPTLAGGGDPLSLIHPE